METGRSIHYLTKTHFSLRLALVSRRRSFRLRGIPYEEVMKATLLPCVCIYMFSYSCVTDEPVYTKVDMCVLWNNFQRFQKDRKFESDLSSSFVEDSFCISSSKYDRRTGPGTESFSFGGKMRGANITNPENILH
jgi:hypothetical protein